MPLPPDFTEKAGPFLAALFAGVGELARALGEPEAVVYARVAEYCQQMAAGKMVDETDPIMARLVAQYGAPQ